MSRARGWGLGREGRGQVGPRVLTELGLQRPNAREPVAIDEHLYDHLDEHHRTVADLVRVGAFGCGSSLETREPGFV